jgi:hypothetical protein
MEGQFFPFRLKVPFLKKERPHKDRVPFGASNALMFGEKTKKMMQQDCMGNGRVKKVDGERARLYTRTAKVPFALSAIPFAGAA